MKNPTFPLNTLATKYQRFTDDTVPGKLGKTAQFWIIYCKIMELYLTMHRAVKINNIELYAYSLFQLTSLFFSTNHSNYARWMTYYALELVNLKEEKPELLEVLKDGAFSINRTGRPFSRVGIDMALEQTIKAEEKSRLKGIVSFADVPTAVNRWIVTGSMRSQIVNSLLEVADLKSYNSDNKELNKPRIERDKKDIEKIKEYICSTTN